MPYGVVSGKSVRQNFDPSLLLANGVRTIWENDITLLPRLVAQGAALAEPGDNENKGLEISYLTNAPAVVQDNAGWKLSTSANTNYGFRVNPVLPITANAFIQPGTGRTDSVLSGFIATPSGTGTNNQATSLAATIKTDATIANFEVSFGLAGGTNPGTLGTVFNATTLPSATSGMTTTAYFIFNTAVSPFWQITTKNAAGITLVTTDVPVKASTLYTLQIDIPPNSITPFFYINGRMVGKCSTLVASTNLGFWLGGKARSAAVRSLYLSSPIQISKSVV